jgi:hypothetical protein
MASDTIKLITPNMRADAVKDFQALFTTRFASWDIAKILEPDGVYGEATDLAARQVCHGLGLFPKSYRDGMTPPIRTKIRHPDKAHSRGAEGGRPAEGMARRAAQTAGFGGVRALSCGRVRQEAPRSQRKPALFEPRVLIDAWNSAVGTPPGPMAFWCGTFVNACLHAAGSRTNLPRVLSQHRGARQGRCRRLVMASHSR